MKDIIISIDKNRLNHNIATIREHLPKSVLLCAVVKSGAYGHGVKRVCTNLEGKVDYFAVTNNFEAFNLRKICKTTPILVLGAFSTHYLRAALKNNIEFGISNKDDLKILNSLAQKLHTRAKIHIKINSGMNRLGLNSEAELSAFYDELKKCKNIDLVGIFSHLGSGDTTSKRNLAQIAKFQRFLSLCPISTLKHLCNSYFYLDKPCFDMVRTGLALYGYGFPEVRPILSIKARVVAINHIKKGDYIGYGNNHRAKRNLTTATIAIGYGEGVPRLWAKNGYCLINGKRCPFVANICMNMSIVEVDENVKIGDYATIIGQDGNLEITATEIAKECKTIEYEILTNFKKL